MVEDFIAFDYDCKSCNRFLTICSFYAYLYFFPKKPKKKVFEVTSVLRVKGYQPNCNNNFCYNKIKN